MSGPVTMNPCSSRSSQPRAHEEVGSPPIRMNSASARSSSLPALPVDDDDALEPSVADRLRDRVFVRIAIRGCASQRSTRYCDIESPSDGPRTSSVTDRASSAAWSAAWPAELAPPTMNTSPSRWKSTSLVAEP